MISIVQSLSLFSNTIELESIIDLEYYDSENYVC